MRAWTTTVAALLLLSAAHSRAAPPVKPDTSPPDLAKWEASFRKREGEHTPLADRTRVRLVLLLDPNDAEITILLPPRVPLAKANRWLQHLVDVQEWSNATLYSTGLPEAVVLTADLERSARLAGPGRRRFALDSAALRALAAEVSSSPPVVFGRSIKGTTPKEAHGFGDSGLKRGRYLASLDGAAPSPLVLEYGVLKRPLFAVGAELLLCLLLPALGGFMLRRRLLGDPQLSDVERLRSYRKSQFLLTGILLLAGSLCSMFIGIFPLVYLAGYAGPGLLPLIGTLLALIVLQVVGRPVEHGIAERLRWPQWHRTLTVELPFSGSLCLVLGVMLWGSLTNALVDYGSAGLRSGAGFLAVLLALLVTGPPIWGELCAWMRSRGTLPWDQTLTGPMMERIRASAEPLGIRIGRVAVTVQPGRGGFPLPILVIGETAVVKASVLNDGVLPHLPLLVTSAALAGRLYSSQAAKARAVVALAALPAVFAVALLVMVSAGLPERIVMWVGGVAVATLPIMVFLAHRVMRRWIGVQHVADVLVVASTGDADGFLKGLRELLKIESGGVWLGGGGARVGISGRIQKLERHLAEWAQEERLSTPGSE